MYWSCGRTELTRAAQDRIIGARLVKYLQSELSQQHLDLSSVWV